MNQPERILFVHAHPDDETISTGGTLATLVDAGAIITVVTCTRGERGEVIPEDLQGALASVDAMATLRERELRAAMSILGVTDHRFLGGADARWSGKAPRRYVDSGMRWGASGAEGTGEYDPASLTSADFGDVAADIAAVILEVQPDAIVSYDERGGYGHPDHIRAHQAARRAADVYGVPFYAVTTPGAAASVSVDVTPVLERKRRALEAYRSQVVVSGEDFALSNGSSQPIGATEQFRRFAVEGEAPYRFVDQPPSAKVGISIVSALVGLAAGAIGSVYCLSTLRVAGANVWAGAIIAAFLLAAVLVGFRLAFGTRLVPLCASIGAIVIVTLFSITSAGGSVLVPLSNPSALAWLIAAVVVAVLVVGWPQGRRRSPGRIAGQASDLKGP